jgi:chromosome segregation ATPase
MSTQRTESEAVSEGSARSPGKRYQMIAEAAYFQAEHRGFRDGDPVNDWLQAEAEIARLSLSPEGGEPKPSKKVVFQETLEAQLKEWDAKLEVLKAMASKATAEARAEYEGQLEALAAKRVRAQEKLKELRERTEDVWEDLKAGVDKTWAEIGNAINKIASHLK